MWCSALAIRLVMITGWKPNILCWLQAENKTISRRIASYGHLCTGFKERSVPEFSLILQLERSWVSRDRFPRSINRQCCRHQHPLCRMILRRFYYCAENRVWLTNERTENFREEYGKMARGTRHFSDVQKKERTTSSYNSRSLNLRI